MSQTEAFASFEHKWLAAHPEQRVIGVFLPAALRRRANAFGTLVHELSQAAFRTREPEVASAKLQWWQRELHEAALGKAKHPVTQALFEDETAHEADPALWPALADGALEQLDQPGAGTLAAMLEQLDPFFDAVARAELALFDERNGNVEANAALWTFAHLLHELPQLAHADGRLPVPLGLLARHELVRADLAASSPRRNLLIKDFLDELVLEIGGALGVAAARPLPLRVRTRLDRQRIARALQVTDPLAYLHAHPHAGRWKTLWTVWREARAHGHELNS
jgi:phytoene synthase